MFKRNKFILTIFSMAAMLAVYTAEAQNYKYPEEASLPQPMSTVDVALLSIAIILLLPVIVMGRSFMASVKIFWEKEKNNKMLHVLLPIAFTLSCLHAGAQDAAAPAAAAVHSSLPATTWALLVTVMLELLVLLFFSIASLRFIKKAMAKETTGEVVAAPAAQTIKKESLWQKVWRKLNNFKTGGGEVAPDTGHNYDGIRELDNGIPPWFTTAFIISIIFACVYLLRYHVFHSAPLQLEEYKTEMALAAQEHEEYISTHENMIDENNVAMLGPDDILTGKTLFVEKCAACHLADGGGIVGPNLTDDYWLHGGSVSSIFKSVKYGWPDKGMIAWKDQLSDKQVSQLSSFIKSLKGTKPQTAKEPQGDLYTDSTAAPVADSAISKAK